MFLELASLQEKKHTLEIGLVDSNILVYFADATDKRRHEKAKVFLDEIIKEPERFVISLQNLREFSSVMIKRKKIKSEELNEYLSLFENPFELILTDSEEDIRKASFLTLKRKTHFWDSLIVAVMQKYGINLIYTENIKDFNKFPEIKTVNPLNENKS